jgi:hypothetical protein
MEALSGPGVPGVRACSEPSQPCDKTLANACPGVNPKSAGTRAVLEGFANLISAKTLFRGQKPSRQPGEQHTRVAAGLQHRRQLRMPPLRWGFGQQRSAHDPLRAERTPARGANIRKSFQPHPKNPNSSVDERASVR